MDIDARIENWRLYFKDRPHNLKTGSLEGNYKEPPITKEMLSIVKEQIFESTAQTRPSLDMKDAILVEKAVIQLPEKNKLVLVCQVMYPYLLSEGNFRRTCKAIGISISNTVFDDILNKSKHMLKNILTQ